MLFHVAWNRGRIALTQRRTLLSKTAEPRPGRETQTGRRARRCRNCKKWTAYNSFPYFFARCGSSVCFNERRNSVRIFRLRLLTACCEIPNPEAISVSVLPSQKRRSSKRRSASGRLDHSRLELFFVLLDRKAVIGSGDSRVVGWGEAVAEGVGPFLPVA